MIQKEKRATFILYEEKLYTLKAIAYFERKLLKDVLDDALNVFFEHKGESFIKDALQERKDYYEKYGKNEIDEN
jgi:phage terminase large subunit